MFSSDWALENDFELDARLVKSRDLRSSGDNCLCLGG